MQHKLASVLIVAAMVVVLGSAGFVVWQFWQPDGGPSNRTNTNQPDLTGRGFTRFGSADELRDYLVTSSRQSSSTSFARSATDSFSPNIEPVGTPVGLGTSENAPSKSIDRVSTTNIQVEGIDEPDIVKTDGQSIFISSDTPVYYYPLIDLPVSPGDTPSGTGSSSSAARKENVSPDILPSRPATTPATTTIVDARPPESLAKIGSIDVAGDLLLVGKTLVVLAPVSYPDQLSPRLVGYNVDTPTTPVKTWTNTLERNTSIVSARLRQGKIYLVLQHQLVNDTPCPVKIMTRGTVAESVPCTDIYHPTQPVPVDTTYSVLVINPVDGHLDQRLTFLGSGQGTVVTMSNDGLYITNTDVTDPITYQHDFFDQAGRGLLPEPYLGRLQRLTGYDLSMNAKVAELSAIFEDYLGSLDAAARERFEQTMTERMKAFATAHVRDYVSTDIVKVGLTDFRVVATGRVPGTVLNQYALDEYQGHLRIATTSNGAGGWWFGSSVNSVNDVYVFDDQLRTTSSVLDLGKGEQIYAVRFVGALGYVVTFRQIDPFYVLDLSDAAAAKLSGELKIPGYSSYLHPLTETLILGVGQEDSHVKVTLFDVSKPNQPTAVVTLALEQYSWTDLQQNPHAFLHDAQRQVVFLPVNAKGVVISYADRKLTTVASVDDIQARRAVYINDTMYIVGTTGIVALDEKTWQTTKRLTLTP